MKDYVFTSASATFVCGGPAARAACNACSVGTEGGATMTHSQPQHTSSIPSERGGRS